MLLLYTNAPHNELLCLTSSIPLCTYVFWKQLGAQKHFPMNWKIMPSIRNKMKYDITIDMATANTVF